MHTEKLPVHMNTAKTCNSLLYFYAEVNSFVGVCVGYLLRQKQLLIGPAYKTS